MIEEIVVTALDVVGLCAVAVGVAAALHPLIGWAGVAGGGLVLLAGARAAEWNWARRAVKGQS